jgi:hypothetical protein
MMKKYIVTIVILLALAACGGKEAKEAKEAGEHSPPLQSSQESPASPQHLWENREQPDYSYFTPLAKPEILGGLEVTFVDLGQAVILHDGKTASLAYYRSPDGFSNGYTVFWIDDEAFALTGAITGFWVEPKYVIYIDPNTFLLVATDLHAQPIIRFIGNEAAIKAPVYVWEVLSIEPGYITIIERVDVLGTSFVVSKYSFENLFNARPTSSMREFAYQDPKNPYVITLREDLPVKQIINSGNDTILRQIVLPAGTEIIPARTNAIDLIVIRDLTGIEYLITTYSRENRTINGILIWELFDGLNMAG